MKVSIWPGKQVQVTDMDMNLDMKPLLLNSLKPRGYYMYHLLFCLGYSSTMKTGEMFLRKIG
jgi:hypothetical protein